MHGPPGITVAIAITAWLVIEHSVFWLHTTQWGILLLVNCSIPLLTTV